LMQLQASQQLLHCHELCHRLQLSALCRSA
jgi:hypothetical protein